MSLNNPPSLIEMVEWLRQKHQQTPPNTSDGIMLEDIAQYILSALVPDK